MSDPKLQQWHFDSPEFCLPENAGVGRMQQFKFNSGLGLYRSEFRVEKDCVITTQSGKNYLPRLLCSQILLSGQAVMDTGDGRPLKWEMGEAMLFRVRQEGTRYLLAAGQTFRHVGVAGHLDLLLSKPGMLDALHYFSHLPKQGVTLRYIKATGRLRKLAAEIMTMSVSDAVQEMSLEGLAQQFYAELLRSHIQNPVAGEPPLWERAHFEDVLGHIENNLARYLSAEDVAKRFGLSKYRLYAMFKAKLNCSYGEYIRKTRLHKAKHLIEESELPPKVVAYEVGYNHVSNFTQAYRQYFGETPGRTLRLKDK